MKSYITGFLSISLKDATLIQFPFLSPFILFYIYENVAKKPFLMALASIREV